MNDIIEVPVYKATKRCGIQRWEGMGDWFSSWSPRNGNNNSEGSWHHWVNLANYILSHPATKIVAPESYRDTPKAVHMYTDCNELTKEQIAELFSYEGDI